MDLNPGQFFCCTLEKSLQLEHPPFISQEDTNVLVAYVPGFAVPIAVNEKTFEEGLKQKCKYHLMSQPSEFVDLIYKVFSATTSSALVNDVVDGTATVPGSEFVYCKNFMSAEAYKIRDQVRASAIFPCGTVDMEIRCDFQRNPLNHLPTGIYLYKRHEKYPLRVFMQTNMQMPSLIPMVLPLYEGKSLMSCVITIKRDLTSEPFATYSESFFTEFTTRGLFSNTDTLAKPHKFEGIEARTQHKCLLDRRWRAGENVQDVINRSPKVSTAMYIMWPSIMNTPELETAVMQVALGMQKNCILDQSKVTIHIVHSPNELRYLCVPCTADDAVCADFDGFFPIIGSHVDMLKTAIGVGATNLVGYPREFFAVSNLCSFHTNPKDVTIFSEGTAADYSIAQEDRKYFLQQAERLKPSKDLKNSKAYLCVFVSCKRKCNYLYMGLFYKGSRVESNTAERNNMFLC